MPDHEVRLNARGVAQAKWIGRVLREKWGFERFDVYFDSGYRRSAETLDLILKAFPPEERIPDKRRSHIDLRERDAGYPFFMTVEDQRAFFPWWTEYEKRLGPIYSRPPGGESIADSWLRVHMFLNSLRRARPGEDILIVTHGRTMLGFKYWMEKIPSDKVSSLYRTHRLIKNCEVWWYRYRNDLHRYTRVARFKPPEDI
jgi:broad specificity phosphatase PhoE